MRPPLVVRAFTEEEHAAILAGLRSPDSLVLRRSLILLTSSRGQHPPEIARALGCNVQTVRNAIHAFNTHGLAGVARASSRPRLLHPAFDELGAERLRDILRRSPREFGKYTDEWTLALAAEVSFEQGLTSHRVSGETIRATLARRGISWERAKSRPFPPSEPSMRTGTG